MDLHKEMDFGDLVLLNFLSLGAEEVEMVRNWRNHETVRNWMYDSDIIETEKHQAFIEGLRSDYKNLYWIAKDKAGNYLGTVYLNKVDLKNENAYFGIYANPDCNISGAGRMLIDGLKRLALDIAHLHTLKLEVMETNRRAVDFYTKSGFVEEGRLKEFVFRDGRWHDMIIMGLINKSDGHDD